MVIIELRSSRMDSLHQCPPSVLAEGIRIAPSTPTPASIGLATHRMLDAFISAEMGKGTEPDLEPSCASVGLTDESDIELVSKFYKEGQRIWARVRQYFPVVQTEAAIRSGPRKLNDRQYEISGTLDLVSTRSDSEAIFLDWKTGFLEHGCWHQMASYAYLLYVFMGRPKSVSIAGIVAWLRHGYYKVMRYDARMLADWEANLIRNVLRKAETYRPGNVCRFCTLRASCEARAVVVHDTVQSLLTDADNSWLMDAKRAIAQVTPDTANDKHVGETVSNMLFRIRVLEQIAKDGKELLRDMLRRVGSIPLHDALHTYLTLKTSERRTLDTLYALPVLQARLAGNDLAECSSVSLTKVIDRYAKRHQRGKKGQAIGELIEELTLANAIRTTKIETLTETTAGDEGDPDGLMRAHPPDSTGVEGPRECAGTDGGEPEAG